MNSLFHIKKGISRTFKLNGKLLINIFITPKTITMKKITFIALLLSMFIVGCEPGNADDDGEDDADGYGILDQNQHYGENYIDRRYC